MSQSPLTSHSTLANCQAKYQIRVTRKPSGGFHFTPGPNTRELKDALDFHFGEHSGDVNRQMQEAIMRRFPDPDSGTGMEVIPTSALLNVASGSASPRTETSTPGSQHRRQRRQSRGPNTNSRRRSKVKSCEYHRHHKKKCPDNCPHLNKERNYETTPPPQMQAQDSFHNPHSTSSSTSNVDSLHSQPGRLSPNSVMNSPSDITVTSPFPIRRATTLPSNMGYGDYYESFHPNNMMYSSLSPNQSMIGSNPVAPFQGFATTGVNSYLPNNATTPLPTSGNTVAGLSPAAQPTYTGGYIQLPMAHMASNWPSSAAPPAPTEFSPSFGQNIDYAPPVQEENGHNQNPSSYNNFDGTDFQQFDYGNDHEREVKVSNTSQKPSTSASKPSSPHASLKTTRTDSHKLSSKHAKDTAASCDSCGSVGSETRTSDSVLRKFSHKLRSAKEWLKRNNKASRSVV